MKKKHDISERIEWLRAWARVELSMSAAEFDLLTPAEFFRIVDRWESQQRRLRVADARLRYTIAASAGASAADGTPLTLAYFLADVGVTRKKVKRKRPTGKQLEAAFIAALPAEWRPK